MQNTQTRYDGDSNAVSVEKALLTKGSQVIQKIGLCICVYDILTASDGLIGHGTGIVNVNGRLGSRPTGSLEAVIYDI